MMRLTSTTPEEYLAQEDVHELMRQPSSGTLIGTLIMALILGFLHGLNVWYLLWQNTPDPTSFGYAMMPVALFFVFHLILAIVSLAYARARELGDRNDHRFDLLLAITTLCLGVAGAIGTVIAILFFGIYQRYATSFAQWFQSIFPMTPPTLPEEISENILTGRDESATGYSVIPFLDVMSIGSEAQKREALSKMTGKFHPSFAPAFQRALSDENNAIRVQAATSIVKIENHFLERAIQLEALYREYPKDDRLLLALARHYDEYAYTGILDQEREETNRARALESYEQYLKLHPQDAQVRLFVGRLLVRSGKTAQAADWFRQSIDAGYSTPQMVSWYLEALYTLGRYDELRQFSTRFEGNAAALQPSLTETLQLWNRPMTGEAA